MSEENRLDRLEKLAEKILEGLGETRQRLEETRQRTDSNARAIEALTHSIAELKQEWQKDRRGIYELLARLTRSQADFYETQSDFYRRFDEIDQRQTDIVQILRELKEKQDSD
ncbi:MAG: hypothetical protein ACREPR_24680 [Brasilonema sp.]